MTYPFGTDDHALRHMPDSEPDPRNAEDQNPDPTGLTRTPTGGGGGGGTGGGGGGSGGSGGGSGGSTPPPVSTGPTDYNDADDQARFLGLAGNPEVWKDSDTGQFFMMYEVPGVEPPIPMLFELYDGMKELEGYFGDNKVVFDRTMTSAEMNSAGSVRFGSTNNLVASEGDPWLGFKDRMDRMAKTTPWIADDEILSLLGGAYLEDRKVYDWEIADTQWSRTHNERERDFLKLSMSDPAQVARQMADDRLFVASLFDKIGASDNDAALLTWMGIRYTSGTWSQAELVAQVEAVTSGWGDVDPDLQDYLTSSGIGVDTTAQGFEDVKKLWDTWLGPAYSPSEEQVSKWATTIRNSADGKEELIDMLRGQRLAMYPGYENPNLTYQDIAGPWRDLSFRMWGQQVDETSDMFQEIVRYNDYAEASKRLRTDGLKENVEKVWSDATAQFRTDQSTQVRRAI